MSASPVSFAAAVTEASEVAVATALWIVAMRVQPLHIDAVSLKAIPARHKDAWRFVVSTNLSGSLSVAGKQVMILLVGTFGGAALDLDGIVQPAEMCDDGNIANDDACLGNCQPARCGDGHVQAARIRTVVLQHVDLAVRRPRQCRSRRG